MWYVVWVKTGEEEKVLTMCEKLLKEDPAVYQECFIPKREVGFRRKTEWIPDTQILFPGYLFFITDDPVLLHEKLKLIPEYTKLLGDGDGPIPLHPQEIEFLREYTDEDRVVRMSVAEMIGRELTVISGPMVNRRGKVLYINRRSRSCILEIDFMGRPTRIKLGLDVVKKTD